MELGSTVLTILLEPIVEWATAMCKIMFHINKEITKLRTTFGLIQAVLQDAENRKNSEPAVYNWLQNLDEIAFDARNVLYDYMRCVEGGHNRMLEAMQTFKLADRIKDIHERLEEVKKQKEILCLIPQETATNKMAQKPDPGYLPNDFLVGRDEIKKSMLDEILELDKSHIKFIPIWGMGGIGKTTLVQHIYNDPLIKEEDYPKKKRKWVFVGENEFDATKIMNIIVGASHRNVATLQEDLIETFNAHGGRFLIVLDDVWSLKGTEWHKIWVALEKDEKKGVVIMTTRDKEVIEEIDDRAPKQLAPLSDNDCWEIFRKCAFKDKVSYPNLILFEKVGQQIVEKLKGLPLAAKLVGNSLRRQSELNIWEDFLHNEEWTNDDDIMQVLKWSYDLLPSNLKPCFAFCSIFPKQHLFNVDELVKMWMAHDFIVVSKGRPEDVGRARFMKMVKLSLFQLSSEGKYVMHDIIHDLARLISSDNRDLSNVTTDNDSSSVGENNDIKTLIMSRLKVFSRRKKKKKRNRSHKRICHLSIDKLEKLDFLDHKILLSFIAAKYPVPPMFKDGKVFSKLEFIRVLVLNFENFKIPDSISELRYIRYIDLLGCSGLESLPESLCEKLHFLQTLKVPNNCSLPKNLGNLIHLRHLDGEASVNSGIGNLTNLQEVTAIKVDDGKKIPNLQNLKNLQGKLKISGLKNISCLQDAEKFFMLRNNRIEELELDFCNNSGSTTNTLEETILDALKPCKYLQLLKISNYVGSRSPNWMNTQHLENLRSLHLSHNEHWKLLPPLGALPWLTTLRLENLTRLEEWVEMESSTSPIFPRLQELNLARCPVLQTMPSFTDREELPKIEICDCEGVAKIQS